MGSNPARSMVTLLGRGDRLPAAEPGLAADVLSSFGAGLLSETPSRANAVVSPYSVYAALAMAATGARRRTADQLSAALGGLSSGEQAGCLTAIENAVGTALAKGAPIARDPRYDDTRPMDLSTANSLFIQHGLAVRPEFLNALTQGFGSGLRQLDYAADPDAARRVVNSWVSDRTAGRIGELFRPGMMTADTLLVLVNALLLTAPWQERFYESETVAPFSVVGGGEVGVRYLSMTHRYEHDAGEGWRTVTIPYRGGGLAMTIVLPDSGAFDQVRSVLPDVLTARQRQSAGTWTGDMLALSLPGFAVNTRLSLVESLHRMGVTDVFDPGAADLSGIAGVPGDLVATGLVHQAVITVDKEGTEAAAATAWSMMASGLAKEPERLVIDRSFLFAVHDTLTGAPLFLGQVIDPTS